MRMRRNVRAIALLLSSGMLLTGCGSQSATSDATSESVAPLPRESVAGPTTSAGGADASEADTTKGDERNASGHDDASNGRNTDDTIPPAARVADRSAGEDQGAKQISQPPPKEVPLTAEDETYLSTLRKQGIAVEGLIPVLTGAGQAICDEERRHEKPVIAGVIAGQLIERKAATAPADALARQLQQAAMSAYCRTL